MGGPSFKRVFQMNRLVCLQMVVNKFNKKLSNSCGDACECEGDFGGDGDVDGTDAVTFKGDFFRKDCSTIPPPCNGDFECDGDVDGSDAVKFKADFFRKDCPSCTFDCF